MMKNLFNELPNEIKDNIYKYDDNIVNKNKFDKVIEELNKKRIIQFVKYNVFDDDKYIYSVESKISRMYLMDLLGNEDFYKYTDYNEKLENYGSYKDLMARNSSKYEIAKNYKNHKELYNIILNEYLNNSDDQVVYDIIEDFNFWIEEHNYFDKRILKNEVFENWDNSTDTDKSEAEEDENSEFWTDETGTEPDEPYETDED